LLPSVTFAPGVDVWIAISRFDPDCKAATTAPVMSTLTYPLSAAGSAAAGIVASTLVESIAGNGSVFAAKVSLHWPVTGSTLRSPAGLALMTYNSRMALLILAASIAAGTTL
jgi:hypothetical protein